MINFNNLRSNFSLLELGMEKENTGKSPVDLLQDFIQEPELTPEEIIQKSMKKIFKDLKEGKKQFIEPIFLEQLHSQTGRMLFSGMLAQFKGSSYMESNESFQILGEFTNNVLTGCTRDKDYNYQILQTVLDTSRSLYTKINNKRQYLFSLISKHGLWQEAERWQFLIDQSIIQKVVQLKEAFARKKARQEAKRQQDENTFNWLMNKAKEGYGVVSKLVWQNQEVEDEDENSLMAKAVTAVFTEYAFFMSDPHIDHNIIENLAVKYAKLYKLGFQKLCEIELELYRCQPIKYAKERKKRIAKIKEFTSLKHFIISLCVPYVGDLLTLRNLLVVNKKMYQEVKAFIFKQILLHLNVPLSTKMNTHLWLQILDIVLITCL